MPTVACHNRDMNTTADLATRLAATREATSPNRIARDTAFKVRDGGSALYTFRSITAEVAADLGCPGANAVLVGGHVGHIIGTAEAVTGRVVKVSPSWGYRFGTLTRFTPWGDTDAIVGHVGAIGGEL